MKRTMLAFVSLALLLPGSLLAAGDPGAGKEKSATCQACHGETGKSVDPSYPNLAGQYASYLEHALKAYRDGSRNNAVMRGFAQNLSDEDIEDLAAWFASQPGELQVLPGR